MRPESCISNSHRFLSRRKSTVASLQSHKMMIDAPSNVIMDVTSWRHNCHVITSTWPEATDASSATATGAGMRRLRAELARLESSFPRREMLAPTVLRPAPPLLLLLLLLPLRHASHATLANSSIGRDAFRRNSIWDFWLLLTPYSWVYLVTLPTHCSTNGVAVSWMCIILNVRETKKYGRSNAEVAVAIGQQCVLLWLWIILGAQWCY